MTSVAGDKQVMSLAERTRERSNLQFTENGDLLSANINFAGRRVYLLVEKSDEPKKDIRQKIKSAKSGWSGNVDRLRRFLNRHTTAFDPRPDFIESPILVSGLMLHLTHTEKGPSSKTTGIEFNFMVPYDHRCINDSINPLPNNVVYNVTYRFKSNDVVWRNPSLEFDFDANAFS